MKFKIGSKLKFAIFEAFWIAIFFSLIVWAGRTVSEIFVPTTYIASPHETILHRLLGESFANSMIKLCGANLILMLSKLFFYQEERYQKLIADNKQLFSILNLLQNTQSLLMMKLTMVNHVNSIVVDKLEEILETNINRGNREEYSEEVTEQNDNSIPMSCLECKYYTDNDYLKCAVHPNLETNCPDFEAGEQIEDWYSDESEDEDEREDEEEHEVTGEVDWIIDNDYLVAVIEHNPDSKLISCLCSYPIFVSLEKYQSDNYRSLSWNYFTCLINDNNRQITECPNCGTHLI